MVARVCEILLVHIKDSKIEIIVDNEQVAECLLVTQTMYIMCYNMKNMSRIYVLSMSMIYNFVYLFFIFHAR